MRNSPWRHQAVALDFIEDRLRLSRSAGENGALLSMAMGTGKSFVTIAEIMRLGYPRVLILCPKKVVAVWPREFQKHTDADVKVCAPQGSTVFNRALEAGMAYDAAYASHKQFVLVLNYEAAFREPFGPALREAKYGYQEINVKQRGLLAEMEFDLIVMDESHRLKAHDGRAARFVHWLSDQIPYRLGLTGTPMPHSPMDIWSQARALDKSVFGDNYFAFRNRYAVMGGFDGKQVVAFKNAEQLNTKLRSLAFSVGNDVLDLPPAHHVERRFELSPAGRKAYAIIEKDFIAYLERGTVTVTNSLTRLLRLTQCTSGYVHDDEGFDVEVDAAKEEELADIFADLPLDQPVVVFCKFRHDLDTIARVSRASERDCYELSGRVDQLAQWQTDNGSHPVLAVQIQAGGVGVDLTRASLCIFFSQTYSLGDYLQAQARVHRPGQERPVTYISLIANDTVDEQVYEALQNRQDVVEAVLEYHRGKRHKHVQR